VSIHLDPNRRAEAIAAGWLAYRERVPGMESAYLAMCEGWRVIAVVADRVIGALFVREGVIHLGIVPEWRSRWASRRLIRDMLSYGKATTIQDFEPQCAEFVSRIGFAKTQGGQYVYRG